MEQPPKDAVACITLFAEEGPKEGPEGMGSPLNIPECVHQESMCQWSGFCLLNGCMHRGALQRPVALLM